MNTQKEFTRKDYVRKGTQMVCRGMYDNYVRLGIEAVKNNAGRAGGFLRDTACYAIALPTTTRKRGSDLGYLEPSQVGAAMVWTGAVLTGIVGLCMTELGDEVPNMFLPARALFYTNVLSTGYEITRLGAKSIGKKLHITKDKIRSELEKELEMTE